MPDRPLTPFTESNLLLAAIQEDWPEARRIARTMLPGERRSLARTFDKAALLLEEYDDA